MYRLESVISPEIKNLTSGHAGIYSLAPGDAPGFYSSAPGDAPEFYSPAPGDAPEFYSPAPGDAQENIIQHFEYVLRDKYSRFPQLTWGEDK